MPDSLSAGVVCCDVDGVPPAEAVGLLRERGIVAMSSTEDADGKTHLRFSPSILNQARQIDRVIQAVGSIRA